jgi:hypothetical protein
MTGIAFASGAVGFAPSRWRSLRCADGPTRDEERLALPVSLVKFIVWSRQWGPPDSIEQAPFSGNISR